MVTHAESCLLILDGGPAGLVASWNECVCRFHNAQPGSGSASARTVIGWIPAGLPARSRRAAERLGELCRMTRVIEGEVSAVPGGIDDRRSVLAEGLRSTGQLVAAGADAVKAGVHRVVWPVQLGGPNTPSDRIDTDAVDNVAHAWDRALLCARLLAIDAGVRGLVIETPMIDLSDAQLMDLAVDLGAPVHHAWWCEQPASERACGACASCVRWDRAMNEAGVPSMPTPVVRAGASRAARDTV